MALKLALFDKHRMLIMPMKTRKSPTPEEMTLRIFRVAEILAKGEAGQSFSSEQVDSGEVSPEQAYRHKNTDRRF
jgi:hypothetical protein